MNARWKRQQKHHLENNTVNIYVNWSILWSDYNQSNLFILYESTAWKIISPTGIQGK